MLYDVDVLIIGGGGAALRSALAAYEKKPHIKIILAVKGKLGYCGTTALACSDRMAFHATLPTTCPCEPENWKYHARDIYEIGGFVSDYDLAVLLAKNSANAFYYLDRLGVPFVKQNGVPVQFLTDGSVYPRACFTGPETAIHIERALIKKLRETNVVVLENTMITDLIVDSGQICGAVGYSVDKEVIIKAKAVVIATGGAGSIYKTNVFPPSMTGDGYAMALRAGAELVNMEFIQIGLSSVATGLACSGSMMRAVPRFVNEKGEEFLKKYQINFNDIFEKGSTWPVSAEHKTSIIDIAVYREIHHGHKVYLDFTQNPEGFDFNLLKEDFKLRYEQEVKIPAVVRSCPYERLKEINPQSIKWLKDRGIDVEREWLEVAPSIQYFQGGIKIRCGADTNIEGLFAAGECAGGQHGANRPGGNSLLDCQVFGKISGENAAEYTVNSGAALDVQRVAKKIFDSYNMWLSDKGFILEKAVNELRETMDRYCSIVRTDEGLKKALDCVSELKEVKLKTKKAKDAVEFKNMLLTAEAVIRSALCRKESRGPHLYFSDFNSDPLPRDEKLNVYFVCSYDRNSDQILVKESQPVRPGEVIS
ncbi:succinate dehydrogenase / fumarate reductase flavoprotein subunit [Caldanaerobius fijiensis DSM 17918]|uniref:Succinate dehydrogenase / fumarate reductase flavoprotein subunit n=1 Tax=Caldanaerobius fijiensis DSM 17918 TaxID=1121256 RepID=A0A1M5CR93_9THEO|nr:FAD-binding protein [Caldanaerobius fijiensis]SHF57264.1 succinate dehydrogenase / fumarate reductase flavoprotein subunit [Caldanaerobius fijiensis DSM 17918]